MDGSLAGDGNDSTSIYFLAVCLPLSNLFNLCVIATTL